jgi:tetratricopeptide (TPR) repeat protein
MRLRNLLFVSALFSVSPSLWSGENVDLSTGLKLYHEKNYDAAQDEFERLDREFPNQPEILYHLGRTARRQKRFDEAARLLERCTRLAPNNAEYFLALGDAYGAIASRQRTLSAATRTCEALEKAVELAPKSEEARAALIDFCRSAPSIAGGGMKRAYDEANALRRLDAPAGTRLLAALFESEKRYDEAIAACEAALHNHPSDYSLLYLLGRLCVVSGSHLDEGIEALTKALEIEVPKGFPNHAFAHLRLGQLYQKKNERADARKHFEATLAEEPNNADAKAALGR